MSDSFQKLAGAVEDHLLALKANGVRYITVAPETLAEMQRSASRGSLSGPVRSVAKPELSRVAPTVQKPGVPVSPLQAPVVRTEVVANKTSAGPFTREAKEAAMAELRAKAMSCVKCPNLAAARTNVVFGVGDMHSPLMFVGEAPGADEDLQGEPFVGKAGQLLTKIIQTMGHSRETVYIANILKCRPDTPGETAGNRKPTLDEMNTCLPYLLAQIDLVQPKVIVALGATAMEGLFGKTIGITKQRGNWLSFRNIPVMPTYHPAYLLRNQALSEKRRVWEDMLQVLEKLAHPISEKQRGYFL
jgi:uracil-DNA glycosylase family 4